ncbi:MFS transporter [Microbispora sp. CSR-4]|uniref:MFS transporter n=1 Tax=Microbispora sp. CSR-4 TaxID=2592813 RepID=UPI0011C7BC58|nr:MFS transporter [Microbispora sp. CSR-4]
MSRLTRPRPWGVLTVLLAGQMMASMDGSIVTVALPSIQHDLRVDDAVLQLVPSAYLLTLGVLNVTGARTGDLIGHRRAFLGGLAAFTLASLLCGLAPAAPVLVAARVAQAVAAALMVPQVFSLIQLRFDGSARKRAIGVYSMVLALGVALGQVIGGLVVGADLLGLTWRPVFLVNVPVGAVLMVVGLRALPESAPVARRLDLGGVALLTAAMSAVIVPLIFGRQYGWPEWAWASLLAGLLLLVVLVRFEGRVVRRGGLPLLDLSVLRPAGVGAALATCVAVMGCYTAFLFVLTLHLQNELGFGPLAAGLAFVPYAIGFATLSLTWARLPEGAQSVLPVAGPAVFAAGALTVAALPGDGWPPALMIPVLFLAGAGHAAGYSPLVARVAAIVGPERASALSALNSTGPVLAGVSAVAGLGSLYLSTGLGFALVAVAALLAAGALSAAAARATWRSGSHAPERAARTPGG